MLPLAIAIILIVGAFLMAQMGVFQKSVASAQSILASMTRPAAPAAPTQSSGGTAGSTADGGAGASNAAGGASGGASANGAVTGDSVGDYERLASAYAKIGALGDRIGNSATKKGFSWGEFSDRIGKGNRSSRQSLVDTCDSYLRTITSLRNDIEGLQVGSSYESQRQQLLVLCDLLTTRMQVMRDTAAVAVETPGGPSWGLVLRPASTKARQAYDQAYPAARPSQL
jgi:hypothetical protein